MNCVKCIVPYRRTWDWYSGHWYNLSTWCNETFGPGNWDYLGECFVFNSAEAETLFLLKWSSN